MDGLRVCDILPLRRILSKRVYSAEGSSRIPLLCRTIMVGKVPSFCMSPVNSIFFFFEKIRNVNIGEKSPSKSVTTNT